MLNRPRYGGGGGRAWRTGAQIINELDCIVLTTDLPEFGLAAGDIGTVVMVHQNAQGLEVEFISLDGQTLAVTSLYKVDP